MLHRTPSAANQAHQRGRAKQAMQRQSAGASSATSQLPAAQPAPIAVQQSSARPWKETHVATNAVPVPAALMDSSAAPPISSHSETQAANGSSTTQDTAATQCIALNPASFPWSSSGSTAPALAPHQPQHNKHMIDLTQQHTSSAYGEQPKQEDPVDMSHKLQAEKLRSVDLSHIQHDGLVLHLHAAAPSTTYQQDLQALQLAAEYIQQGQPVAIPTETVYGLAADALSADAVKSIYAAKSRPADNPLIVHISSLDMLYSLYPPGWMLPEVYREVVAAHWPGPLTILLPAPDKIPSEVVCGQPTVAVRMPDHPVARALIALSGRPLAAPSANSSGKPSPTTAQHVMQDLAGRIPLVLDGGPCNCGVESTVLDGLRQPPVVLRPGGVTVEQLSHFTSMQGLQVYRKDFVDERLEAAPTTPGMKYRHYSPQAPITLLDLHACQGHVQQVRSKAQQEVARLVTQAIQDAAHAVHGRQSGMARGMKVGVLRTSKGADCLQGLTAGDQLSCYCASSQWAGDGGVASAVQLAEQGVEVVEYVLGDLQAASEVARELFKALRQMDECRVSYIVAEGVQEHGEGLAVMNRLRKAATHVVQL